VYVLEGGNTAPDTLVSADLQAGQLRVVLTWGQQPSDLDSWLLLPDDTSVYPHLYYGAADTNNNQLAGSTISDPFAELDVDDRSSFGPETITITQTYPGTYRYYVHNYSGESQGVGFSQSTAVVRVFGESGLAYEASVPMLDTGDYWHVFDFDGTTLQLTPVNMVETTAPTLPPPACQDGLTDCGNGCTDTSNDTANCGACDTACDVSEFCFDGTCTLG
jgi:hypothetical protein